MAYRWQAELDDAAFTTADELDAAGLEQRFEDQAAAEAWLGAFYTDLLDLQVSSVSLYEEDRLVYGPMGLEDM